MNKKLLFAIVAVVLVIAAMLGLYFGTRQNAQEGIKNITVIVVHSDGSEKTFTYSTDAEYLSEVLVAEGLVTGSTGEYGFMVESVDGVVADWTADSAYWALYIGDEYATDAASGIVLEDGGVYKLVYETI